MGHANLRGGIPTSPHQPRHPDRRLTSMPTRPQARCTFTGCKNKAVNQGRCNQHQRKPWQNQSAHTRERALHRAEWNHIRSLRLKLEPNCRRCNSKGTNVDHITPVGAGGAFLDINNTQTLCNQCKTIKDQEDRKNYPHIFH
ncbi:HNH endonuclease [Bifidobacterium moukalabense]|uniref:HNH endonuclease n=1 Tax=Bifidobacterium moukalabense TaxID=1333651 RepID=UPI0009DDE725